MSGISARKFSDNMEDYIQQVKHMNELLNVVYDDGDIVIISGNEFRRIEEMLYLQSINMEKKILKSAKEPREKLDWRGEYNKRWN